LYTDVIASFIKSFIQGQPTISGCCQCVSPIKDRLLCRFWKDECQNQKIRAGSCPHLFEFMPKL
jgi:hypothetical protein